MSRLPKEPPSGEITPEALYLRRREFLKSGALFVGTASAIGAGLVGLTGGARSRPAPQAAPLPEIAITPAPPGPDGSRAGQYDTDEPKTPFADVTTYNNYYEFGLRKSDPAENAHTLRTRPWTIAFTGEIKRPQVIDIETILRWFPPEERVYRMRCVEAWSMVIPWLGFPLGALLARLEPTSRAKYVAFTTLSDPEQLPGQRRCLARTARRSGWSCRGSTASRGSSRSSRSRSPSSARARPGTRRRRTSTASTPT